MFVTSENKEFVNRAHIGEYARIEFDTYVQSNGQEEIEGVSTSMHYIRMGQGEPLLLIHGPGQSLYTFRKLFEELSQHFSVFAIDLPGHGFSEKPHISYSVEEVALSIEAFMNELQLPRTHFCAFGESAAYVIDFALHNQKRAGNLIFVSPMIVSTADRRPPYFPLAQAASRLLFGKSSFARDLSVLFFDQTLLTQEILEEYYLPFADKEFRQIVRIYEQNYNDNAIVSNILELTSPVLVIRGGDDKVSPPLNEGLAGFPIRDIRTYTIRNCNYFVQEEKADRLAAAILEFAKLNKERQ